MATNTENQDKLADLFAKLQAATAAYNKSYAENQTGHSYQQQGNWTFPYSGAQTDEGSFYNWLSASDASLPALKNNVDAAQKAYDALKKQIEDLAVVNFATTNPKEYAQVLINKDTVDANKDAVKAKADADAEAAKIKAQIDADAAKFAQSKSEIIFYVGIVVVVIAVGVGVYLKFFKKKKEGI